LQAPRYIMLCKKYFFGASRRIMFWETRHFRDFASRNRENDASLRRIFCRLRRQKPFFYNLETLYWGCVKSLFGALRTKLHFERHVIFAISLREIVKVTRLSEEYSAAKGGKNLFSQPRDFILGLC
jgi:hypothetical protein